METGASQVEVENTWPGASWGGGGPNPRVRASAGQTAGLGPPGTGEDAVL